MNDTLMLAIARDRYADLMRESAHRRIANEARRSTAGRRTPWSRAESRFTTL